MQTENRKLYKTNSTSKNVTYMNRKENYIYVIERNCRVVFRIMMMMRKCKHKNNTHTHTNTNTNTPFNQVVKHTHNMALTKEHQYHLYLMATMRKSTADSTGNEFYSET